MEMGHMEPLEPRPRASSRRSSMIVALDGSDVVISGELGEDDTLDDIDSDVDLIVYSSNDD